MVNYRIKCDICTWKGYLLDLEPLEDLWLCSTDYVCPSCGGLRWSRVRKRDIDETK